MIGSIFNTSCDEVWQNMSPGYGESSHYLVGIPIMRLHDASLTFTNVFFSSVRGFAPIFFLIRFSECLCILFEFFLFRVLIVPFIVYFFYTIISVDEVKVYSGFLFIVFCCTFIIPSFTTLIKHNLIANKLGLVLTIRIVVSLVI